GIGKRAICSRDSVSRHRRRWIVFDGELNLARGLLSDNVGNHEQCHVNSGGYAGGGIEFTVHRQARIRWRDTESREQIARLPMPSGATARKQSGGGQQERTGADAEHVFGLCGLPPYIC